MKQAFHFKNSNCSIGAININVIEFNKIEKLINLKISQSKLFFNNAPFAIDIRDIDKNEKCSIIFLEQIISIFKLHGMIPIGFILTNNNLKIKLIKAGYNILKNIKYKTSNIYKNNNFIYAKIIDRPVRTGQLINATNQDLIVIGNVNNGAEIIADGNIIVYGKISGRVIAGCSGNKEAKIICKDLKAELVSIAGIYVTFNNNIISNNNNGYIVYLQNDKIYIKNF